MHQEGTTARPGHHCATMLASEPILHRKQRHSLNKKGNVSPDKVGSTANTTQLLQQAAEIWSYSGVEIMWR